MIRKRLLTALGLSATFFVIGCATDDQARASLAETNARLTALEQTVGVLNTKTSTQKMVDLLNKLDSLQTQIDNLNGNVDTIKQDQQSYKATQDQLYQSLEQQIQTLQQGSGGKATQLSKTNTSSPVIDSTDSSTSLKLAVKQVKGHQFTQAIKSLKNIMTTSNDPATIASATYYLAVAYAANGQYKSAVAVANKFVADNPNDSNAPDAMRIVYISQTQLGLKKSAENTAQKLIKNYPDSDAAQKIQQ